MTVKSLRTPWMSDILFNRADSFFYSLEGVCNVVTGVTSCLGVRKCGTFAPINVPEQMLFMPGRGFLLLPTHDIPVYLKLTIKRLKKLTKRIIKGC
jgi:hypothetical protein